jgi:hypothetical protein
MPDIAKLVYWTICEGTIGQEVLNIHDFSELPRLKGFPRVSGQCEEPTKAKGGNKTYCYWSGFASLVGLAQERLRTSVKGTAVLEQSKR